MCHLWNIAIVMLVSGTLGGIVNSFLADPADGKPLNWWKHVAIGIAAAFIVPLFLNMISGDLIDKIRGSDGRPSDYSKLFVLAGFCLVAAISSRKFIQSISDRVLQEVKAANKNAAEAKVDAAEAKAVVAPLVEDEAPDTMDALKVSSLPITAANELAILKAMSTSSYPLRSITGIAKDSGLSKDVVNSTLSSLIGKGLVQQGTNTNGQPRWFLSSDGRKIANDG